MSDSWPIYLLEKEQAVHYSLHKNRDRREFRLREKAGLLFREKPGESYSLPLASPSAAAKILPRAFLSEPDEEHPVLEPGRILEENSSLLRWLQLEKWDDWQVLYRARCNRRLVACGSAKPALNRFCHFSLLVRVKKGRHWLAAGEGRHDGPDFNLSGIFNRLLERLPQVHNWLPESGEVMPVVLSSGEGAMLFHEILGHSLEADYVLQGLSPFSSEDLGRQIMSSELTVCSGDAQDLFFSGISHDDEGSPRKEQILIEKGVLRSFISDRRHADLLGLEQAGHARLEDFQKLPQPRMFGLLVQNGKTRSDDIVGGTGRGVLALEFSSGRVALRGGRFYFRVGEAFAIENGRLTGSLGPLLIAGNIRDVLNGIQAIGDDFRYDRGMSYCHKNGDTVSVRVGQPTVKIASMTVIPAGG